MEDTGRAEDRYGSCTPDVWVAEGRTDFTWKLMQEGAKEHGKIVRAARGREYCVLAELVGAESKRGPVVSFYSSWNPCTGQAKVKVKGEFTATVLKR